MAYVEVGEATPSCFRIAIPPCRKCRQLGHLAQPTDYPRPRLANISPERPASAPQDLASRLDGVLRRSAGTRSPKTADPVAPSIKPPGSVVRVLIAPPITPPLQRFSCGRANSTCFAGVLRGCLISATEHFLVSRPFGRSVSVPKINFSQETGDWFDRDRAFQRLNLQTIL